MLNYYGLVKIIESAYCEAAVYEVNSSFLMEF